MIVPVRDGESSLPALLSSLAQQTLDRSRFEVVVVDNASRDATAAMARAAGAIVIHEPVPNRSRARNRGAQTAASELLAFTDVDCVPDTGWLEALLACASRAPLMAGAVRVTTADAANAIERFEALWRFSQREWVALGWAATANLCVSRAAYESVGGLDPAYPHIGEDVDFCIRAGRAGHGLAFCSAASMSHHAESSLRPFLRRAFFHGHGSSQVLRRLGFGHRAWRDPLPLVRGDLAMGQLGLVRSSFSSAEWRRMRSLAQVAYAARVAGSLWETALALRAHRRGSKRAAPSCS